MEVNLFAMLPAAYNLMCKPATPIGQVQHLQVEPTNYCNQHCVMCNRTVPFGAHLNDKHLGAQEFDDILTQVQPEYVSLVGYGEPLLHPAFHELVEVAVSHNVKVSVTSNLSVPNADVSVLAMGGIENVYVSLDHPLSEGHAAMGRTGFDVVQSNLDRLVSLRKARGGTPKIRLQSIIMSNTYRHLSALADFAARAGVDYLMLAPCHYMWDDKTWQRLVGDMDRRELHDSMKQCARQVEKHGLASNVAELVQQFDSYWDLNCTPREGFSPCVNFWGSCFIDAHGDIRPCGVLSWKPLGNVFQRQFYDVWQGKEYAALRKGICSGGGKDLICNKCIPQNCSPRSFMDVVKLKIRGFSELSS